MNMYAPCQLPVSRSIYPASYTTAQASFGPGQIPSTASEPDQQTGTLHLLEKPEANLYLNTPCSQLIFLHHNVPQSAGSLHGLLWPFGGTFFFKNKNKLSTSIFGLVHNEYPKWKWDMLLNRFIRDFPIHCSPLSNFIPHNWSVAQVQIEIYTEWSKQATFHEMVMLDMNNSTQHKCTLRH